MNLTVENHQLHRQSDAAVGKLLTREEAARSLSISVRHLSKQDIPLVRIGRSVRYRPDDLERWIALQVSAGSPGQDSEMRG